MTLQPLVHQLHFARSEFKRCLDGVSEDDAQIRVGSMNCISWIVGHLANQEYRYWVILAQGIELEQASNLNELVGFGKPPSNPSLVDMWSLWEKVTKSADIFLNMLKPRTLLMHLERKGEAHKENIGTLLQRNIYHYWFHNGEAHAIRQNLGHSNLPEFVGNMASAPYIEK